MRSGTLLLLLSLFTLSRSYSCNPSICLPPSCRCASTTPPTRLDGSSISIGNIPQFVTVTWDDAVNTNNCFQFITPAVLTSTSKDSIGCKPRNTFYVSTYYTNYSLVQQLYASGHEIADHTVTHTTSTGTNYATWMNEVHSSRVATSELARVPLSDIRGFRAPFLKYNTALFDALYAEGLTYDSSITDFYGNGLSNPTSGLTWPYTFDYGTPQQASSGVLPTKVYPGLWEVPMAAIHNADNSVMASMDPQASGAALLAILQRNFLQHYNTNRSPFGLYVHAALWLAPDQTRIQVVSQFYDWVSNYPGVVFATAGQIVDYMRNPVPVSELQSLSAFQCVNPPTVASPEVCDGIDNDHDGVVDEGVLQSCSYPSKSVWFSSCAPCPAITPDLNCPWPGYSGPTSTGTTSSKYTTGSVSGPSTTGSAPSTTGRIVVTTGRNAPITTSPSTTSRVSLTTNSPRTTGATIPLTTGSQVPSTTGRISTPTTGNSPASCTLGEMICASQTTYQTCSRRADGSTFFSAAQSCQTGLSCHQSGMYIYCY